MITRSQVGIYRSNSRYTFQILAMSELPNVKMTKEILEWNQAILDEIDALNQNNTWVLVPWSPQHNVLTYKWVYWIKQNE